MFGFTTRRRHQLQAQPFPESWRVILEHNVSYYRHLTLAEQAELQKYIQVFVAEKSFEGCGDLVITDEIRVTIAAYACILLLHRPHDYYPRLGSILVYPDAYVVKTTRPGPGNTYVESDEVRFGESWRTGAVVLSWNHVLGRAAELSHGRNVALHEFAHQLDTDEGGRPNGAPLLPKTSTYAAWARILGREYQALMEAADSDQPTLIDKYGATDPAEFFAVVTEHFFEKPRELKEQHSELYAELQRFYQQDPAASALI